MGQEGQEYAPLASGALFFRAPELDDLDSLYSLEEASYPADEMATRDKLEFRIKNAPSCFLVAVRAAADDGEDIIGFTCGTITQAASLTHESMSEHKPDGSLLCIHSVVVSKQQRRKGIATRMLRAYLMYVAANNERLKQVRLICKEQLVDLYKGAGFQLVGPSPVEHGQDPWLEFALRLNSVADAEDD